MTSDPLILIKRIRHLSLALIISGALNIGVLSLLLYWVLRERPPTPYCELKPASYAEQQIPLADQRGCSELLTQLSQLSFNELVNRLSNTRLIEDGYAERDFALACLTTFHHFDIQRGLPKNMQPLQMRLFSWKPKAQMPPVTLAVYPDLQQPHYDALIQFAKTERWPLTSEGLFLLLQKQKEKNELNENLMETFVLTPEFWTAELLFNRSGQHLPKLEILTVLLEGNWTLLKQFVDQQRLLQDSSDARRQKFLLDYLKAGSRTATLLLLKTEYEFSVKKLDDQQVVAILQLMPADLPESESFAKDMLASPRSTNVWKQASQWLYMKAGEPVPGEWDYQQALVRFVPEISDKVARQKLDDPLLSKPPMKSPSSMTVKGSPIQAVSSPKTAAMAAPKPFKVPPPKAAAENKISQKIMADAAESTKEAILKQQASKKSAKPIPTPAPKYQTYIVQEGDSLWKIARRFGIKIEDIRTLNEMKSDTLKAGATIKIPNSKEKKP